MTGTDALRKAKEILGSEAAVARVVGRTQPAINNVLRSDLAVPAEWCIPLEQATAEAGEKVCRSRFRPDLWPELAARRARAA